MNALLFISFGLAGGLAIGGFIGAWFINAKWEKVSNLHHLITSLHALEAMRADKMERAIKLSESMLDFGIMGVGRRLESISARRRNPDDVDWLRRARDYRVKYPRTGHSEVDLAVTKAFAIID